MRPDECTASALLPDDFRALIEQSSDAVAILTGDDAPIGSRIVYVNRAFVALSGYSEEQLLGHSSLLLAGARPCLDLVHEILRAPRETPFFTSARKLRPDGSAYDVALSLSPLRDACGGVTHVVLRERDVTEERRADTVRHSQIMLTDRHAAIRGMASGTAYELEAPLASLRSHLQKALEACELDDEGVLAPMLRSALEASARMNDTVRGLQAFARPETPVGVLDVHEALEVAVQLTGAEIGRKATLVRRYGAVARVRASLPRLANVIVSVLRNAAESIPDTMPHANGVSIETRATPDGSVSIEITDTGVGIEEDDLPFVFDPFFTTKAGAGRVGLGLAAVRAAVLEMGGSISLDSVFGRGSRVRIVLPADANDEGALPYPVCEATPIRRVLCVGDSTSDAGRVAALFEERDTHVLHATPAEALEELALHGPYDLVACGLRSGARADFHARLRQLAPDALARTFDVALPARGSGSFRRVDSARPDSVKARYAATTSE